VTDQPAAAVDPTAVLDSREAGDRAIRGSALRVVGYAASVLLSVVGAALMTRHLGTVDYGRYAVVGSVIAIITGLAESGMLNVGVREYAVREGEARALMLRDMQGLRVTFNVAGIVLATAFGLVAGYPQAMVIGIALTGTGLLLQTLQQTWSIPLIAGLRLGWVTVLDLVRQTAQVGLIVALVIAGAGLLPFYVVPIPVGVVLIAVTLPLIRGIAPLRAAFSWERWKPLLRMIGPYATAVAVSSIYVYLSAVLLSLIASGEEVGLYSAAFRVFIVLGGVPLLLVGSAFPIVARAARDDAGRLAYATRKLYDTSLIAGAWIGLLTVLCAPLVIDVIAGRPEYDGAVPVLRLQGVAVVSSFVAVTGGYVLVSLNRNRVLVLANVAALALSAALTLSLASALGAKAGAIANIGGETAIAIAYLVAIARTEGGMPVSRRVAGGVVAATALAAAPVLIGGLAPLVLGILATAIFFAVLLAVRAIPQELLDVIPRRR
jgi:O-antigen/teichoic acid export membrane protein